MLKELVDDLQKKYPEVYWVFRDRDKARATGAVTVRLGFDESRFEVVATISSRALKERRTVEIEDLPEALLETLKGAREAMKVVTRKKEQQPKAAYGDAVKIGRGLVRSLGGECRRALENRRWFEAYLGAGDRVWLRFTLSDVVRSRFWSTDCHERWLSTGFYAWIIHIDIAGQTLRAAFPFNSYATRPHLLSGLGLREALAEGSAFAGMAGWMNQLQNRSFALPAD